MNRYFKKLTSIIALLSLMLMTFLSIPNLGVAAPKFKDLDGHWARGYIRNWANQKLVAGYTEDNTFRPDREISKAEFIVLVNRVMGYKDIVKIDFPDVPKGSWFRGDVVYSQAAGYSHGYADGSFGPNTPLSREEAAHMIYRVMKLENTEVENVLADFADAAQVNPSYREAVNAVVAQGYLRGYPDKTVGPKRTTTRAEMIIILDRIAGEKYLTAGKFGPASGQKVIKTNVTVSKTGISLQNMLIEGDLHLTEGIRDGDVYLHNVIVQGRTIIAGGGLSSIHIAGTSNLGQLEVNSATRDQIRLAIDSKQTVADQAVFRTGTVLDIAAGDSQIFNKLSINPNSGRRTAKQEFTLAGNIGEVEVSGKAIALDRIKIGGGQIKQLNLSSQALIDMAAGAIGTLTANHPANTTEITVAAEASLGDVQRSEGSIVIVNGVEVTDKPTTPVTAITVTAQGNVSEITAVKGTLQMLATVKPTTASNQNVAWSVTNVDGSATDLATISASGLLTAAKNGQVKVRATSVGTPAVQGELVIAIKGQILPSTIVFTEAGPIAKIVGDKPFINTVTGEGKGTITYVSATPATATVNKTTGEVTIVALGSTVITATKAATETHGEVTNSYTINVTKTATTPLASVSIIGKVEVGQELTAELMPKDATVTYQWIKMQKISSAVDIPGATTNKYTPVAEDEGWRIMITATGTGNYSGTVNDVSKPVSAAEVTKINPIVNQAVAATKLNAGETLAKSTLSGTFKNASNQAVAGKLTWTAPTTVVHSSGNYSWTFTPADTLAYNVIKGEVKVTAIMLEFAGGDGTKTNPYQVATAQQLDNVRKHADKFFIQTADINLGVAPWNSGEGWEPIGSVQRFSGSYDGNAYKISGLTINTNDEFMGLFRTTEKNAQLTKISLVDVNIKGGKCTGGLVANHTGGTISECYVTGSVTGSGNTTGGLVGQNVSMLRDSYASCVVTGVDYVGGLVGNNTALGPTSMGVIKDCYATGLVKGNLNSSGGLVGRNHQTITASYYDMYSTGQGDSGKGEGKVTEDMIRAKAFSGWDFDSTWRVQASNSSYPYFKWQTNNIPYFPGDFAGGSGTSADPYQVATAKQLDNVRKHSNRFFIQTADINLDVAPWNSGEGWEPIGSKSATSFKSNYNGNGFKISGLTINRQNTSRQALFERLDDGGSLMNIHLREVNITGRNWVAPLVAANYGGDILRCSATGYVHGRDGSYVGGLVGWHGQGNKNALISESYSTCTIGKVMDGRESNVGGLVGTNNAKIDRSFATGTLNFGLRAVGGLVGFNTGQITNCYSTGEVNGLEKLGGVVGENTKTGLVDRCYAVGKVEKGPWGHQAGIVGYNDGTVTNCYYDKETTGRDDKGKGEPKTTKEMKTYSTFKNWSFQGEYWRMSTTAPGSYPYFSWQGATLIPR